MTGGLMRLLAMIALCVIATVVMQDADRDTASMFALGVVIGAAYVVGGMR